VDGLRGGERIDGCFHWSKRAVCSQFINTIGRIGPGGASKACLAGGRRSIPGRLPQGAMGLPFNEGPRRLPILDDLVMALHSKIARSPGGSVENVAASDGGAAWVAH